MVKRERTDNGKKRKDRQWLKEKGQTMVKRERTKRKTRGHKTLHRKLKINTHKPYRNIMCSGRVSSSCSTNDTLPVCYSCHKSGKTSSTCMRKEPDCDYDKRNISVVICDTDIPNG